MAEIIDIGALGSYSQLVGYGICDAAGIAVPTSALGFAHGSLFRKVSGVDETDAIYVNVGTSQAPNFRTLAVIGDNGILVDRLSGDDLTLNSTNEINVTFGGVSALAIDDAAIIGNAAAADTDGKSVFIETQDGGAYETIANGADAGHFTLTAGIGAASDDRDSYVDGESGSISFITQVGVSGPAGDPKAGVIRLIAAAGAGGVFYKQAAPVDESGGTSQTYSAADLLNGLVVSSGQTGAVTGTLDTGANMDTAVSTTVAANEGFFWSLINQNTSSGAVTITASAGHTLVTGGAGAGGEIVAIGTSARFFTRRTAANTWITYRVA